MGCASSKIDDLPAVHLCRDRLTFLDDALHHRFALAEAHFAYVESLKSLATSFHHFFDSAEIDGSNVPASPVLNLPAQRKGEPVVVEDNGGARPGAAGESRHLSSVSGSAASHFHFHSDSEDDDDEDDSGSDSLHHHLHPDEHHHNHLQSDSPPARMIPRHFDEDMYRSSESFVPYPSGSVMPYSASDGGGVIASGGYVHMNYMKKQPTQSVLYQQKPGYPPGAMHQMGDSGYFPNYSSNQNPNSYHYVSTDTPYDYFGYSGPGGGGGRMGLPGSGGGGGLPGPYGPQQRQGGMGLSSSSKPAPPPPPPPSTSSWDFLNPFESVETSYPGYTPSLDSREVREEEVIPDLEYDDYQREVVKEVQSDPKIVDCSYSGRNRYGKAAEEEPEISGANNDSEDLYRARRSGRKRYGKAVEEEPEISGSNNDSEALYRARPSASREAADPVEYEVHVMDKIVVGEGGRLEDQSNVGAFQGQARGFRTFSEVVKEIQDQFERASASGNELIKILEVGRLPYHRKNAAYQVSTKMFHAITPSLPSTFKDSEGSTSDLVLNEEVGLISRTLSSTLHKLYLWEKKLLEEVKAEEKMRVVHDRKLLKLRRLDEKGAESHKVDMTKNVVRRLSTKIKIAIQLVDRISVKINKLRDDELWPQLNELIKGLGRMWKIMLECHHRQFQAVDGARGFDAIAFPKNPTNVHLEATRQLAYDLISWTKTFSNWIDEQKSYVRALNSWLRKCLSDEEPIVTDDGLAPFSPGRMGAPPVFVICYQWSQSMDALSEKEVLASMQVFAMMVYQFWEQDKAEMQPSVHSSDIESKVRNLDKEDMKMQKEIRALDKKMALVSGDANGISLSESVVYQSGASKKVSLLNGLQRMFEAMDRFAAESVKISEDLLQRTEEICTVS